MKTNWHKALLSGVLLILGISAGLYGLFFPEKQELVGEAASEQRGKHVEAFKEDEVNRMIAGWQENPQWAETPVKHALFLPSKYLYIPDKKEVKIYNPEILVGGYKQFPGFTLGWMEKYKLPINDRMVAVSDPDGDGFPNVLEYLGQTDPKDPQSHPSYITRLRVKDFNFKPMLFRLTSVNEVDGKFLCGLVYGVNLKNNRKNRQVSTGDVIEGFTIGEIRRKIEKRKVAGTDLEEDIEVSEVDLENIATETKVIVKMNQPDTDASEVSGNLLLVICGPDCSTPIPVKQGADFEVKGAKYRFVKGDSSGGALIRDLETKQESTIPKLEEQKDFEYIVKPQEKPPEKK